MLGKLLKYELRSTSRIFGLCYSALLALSIISGLLIRFFDNSDGPVSEFFSSLSTICVLLYMFLIGAICVLTFVLILQRFYKNLLQQEGYLMHTLPVSMTSHIAAKLLAALLWTIVSALAVCLSIGIFAIAMEPYFSWSEFSYSLPDLVSMTLQALGRAFECPGAVAVLLLLLLLLVSAASSILFFYLCLAVGHLAARRKLLCSFLAYIVISTVMQVLVAGVMNLIGNVSLPTVPVYGSILLATVGAAILGAVCFLVTDVLMTKKLNLE